MLKKLVLLSALSCCASFAATIAYTVSLNGANESPVNASPGIGSGTVIFDTVANTMALNVSFSGLAGTVTASHIHCCTAVAGVGTGGVATTTPTFAGFPSGVTSGTYSAVLDLTLASSYNPSFVTANGGTTATAAAALIAGAANGMEYWNIHTTVVPGGEIRGFLTPTPEPATFGMMGAAVAVAGLLRRKFRA